jgi:hypothetical protein
MASRKKNPVLVAADQHNAEQGTPTSQAEPAGNDPVPGTRVPGRHLARNKYDPTQIEVIYPYAPSKKPTVIHLRNDKGAICGGPQTGFEVAVAHDDPRLCPACLGAYAARPESSRLTPSPIMVPA